MADVSTPSPCTHKYAPPFPQLRTYLMDGLFVNQRTNQNIGISYSLNYKHSKKNSLRKMVVQDEINIQGSSINQKLNSAMSVMLCTGATFVKKNSVASFNDTVGLHLLTFRILEPYPSKNILTLMALL